MSKISRNSTCPCGSGRKFKNCCAERANFKSTSNFFFDQKIILTISFFLLYVVFSEINFILQIWRSPKGLNGSRNNTVFIRDFESKISKVRNSLKNQEVIGYLDDNFTSINAYTVNRGVEYNLSQYFLAPIAVSDHINHDLIIGNFYNTKDLEKRLASKNISVTKNFGNGIFLLRPEVKLND